MTTQTPPDPTPVIAWCRQFRTTIDYLGEDVVDLKAPDNPLWRQNIRHTLRHLEKLALQKRHGALQLALVEPWLDNLGDNHGYAGVLCTKSCRIPLTNASLEEHLTQLFQQEKATTQTELRCRAALRKASGHSLDGEFRESPIARSIHHLGSYTDEYWGATVYARLLRDHDRGTVHASTAFYHPTPGHGSSATHARLIPTMLQHEECKTLHDALTCALGFLHTARVSLSVRVPSTTSPVLETDCEECESAEHIDADNIHLV